MTKKSAGKMYLKSSKKDHNVSGCTMDHLSQLSHEIISKILEFLPIRNVMRLDSLSKKMREAVILHLRVRKKIDLAEHKLYGWMSDKMTDSTLKAFLSRCRDLEYIYGFHPKNLSSRKKRGTDLLTTAGIVEALMQCKNLKGIELSNITVLETVVNFFPRIKIVGTFKNRDCEFPAIRSKTLNLPENPYITSLHLHGIVIPSLNQLTHLNHIQLRWVQLSDPHPFRDFSAPNLQTFVMAHCAGPTCALRYVPLLVSLAAARNLSRLEFLRVPYLGGLIYHIVQDGWQVGAFRRLRCIRFGVCKHALETDVGSLAITSAHRLEEICLQPSLSKDSLFLSLQLAAVSFPMFEKLHLGFVDSFPEPGTKSNVTLKTLGLDDVVETPAFITDVGMKAVGSCFPSLKQLEIFNSPYIHNTALWTSVGLSSWNNLTDLTLICCLTLRLTEFCSFISELPSLTTLHLEHMFREPPKGCSRVGLSAGTGMGMTASMILNQHLNAAPTNNNTIPQPQNIPQPHSVPQPHNIPQDQNIPQPKTSPQPQNIQPHKNDGQPTSAQQQQQQNTDNQKHRNVSDLQQQNTDNQKHRNVNDLQQQNADNQKHRNVSDLQHQNVNTCNQQSQIGQPKNAANQQSQNVSPEHPQNAVSQQYVSNQQNASQNERADNRQQQNVDCHQAESVSEQNSKNTENTDSQQPQVLNKRQLHNKNEEYLNASSQRHQKDDYELTSVQQHLNDQINDQDQSKCNKCKTLIKHKEICERDKNISDTHHKPLASQSGLIVVEDEPFEMSNFTFPELSAQNTESSDVFKISSSEKKISDDVNVLNLNGCHYVVNQSKTDIISDIFSFGDLHSIQIPADSCSTFSGSALEQCCEGNSNAQDEGGSHKQPSERQRLTKTLMKMEDGQGQGPRENNVIQSSHKNGNRSCEKEEQVSCSSMKYVEAAQQFRFSGLFEESIEDNMSESSPSSRPLSRTRAKSDSSLQISKLSVAENNAKNSKLLNCENTTYTNSTENSKSVPVTRSRSRTEFQTLESRNVLSVQNCDKINNANGCRSKDFCCSCEKVRKSFENRGKSLYGKKKGLIRKRKSESALCTCNCHSFVTDKHNVKSDNKKYCHQRKYKKCEDYSTSVGSERTLKTESLCNIKKEDVELCTPGVEESDFVHFHGVTEKGSMKSVETESRATQVQPSDFIKTIVESDKSVIRISKLKKRSPRCTKQYLSPKPNMCDQGTSTRDTVVEPDYVQVLKINSKTLTSLSLVMVGVTDVMLEDCGELSKVTGHACRVLKKITMTNSPKLKLCDFTHCAKLDEEHLAMQVATQEPEKNKVVYLRPLHQLDQISLEGRLFSSQNVHHHICVIYDYSPLPGETRYNKSRIVSWGDLFSGINLDLLEDSDFIEHSSVDWKPRYPWGRHIYSMNGMNDNGSHWEMITDLPWLRHLSERPDAPFHITNAFDQKKGVYSPGAKQHYYTHMSCTGKVYNDLCELMLEHKNAGHRLLCYSCIFYINMCDVSGSPSYDPYFSLDTENV